MSESYECSNCGAINAHGAHFCPNKKGITKTIIYAGKSSPIYTDNGPVIDWPEVKKASKSSIGWKPNKKDGSLDVNLVSSVAMVLYGPCGVLFMMFNERLMLPCSAANSDHWNMMQRTLRCYTGLAVSYESAQNMIVYVSDHTAYYILPYYGPDEWESNGLYGSASEVEKSDYLIASTSCVWVPLDKLAAAFPEYGQVAEKLQSMIEPKIPSPDELEELIRNAQTQTQADIHDMTAAVLAVCDWDGLYLLMEYNGEEKDDLSAPSAACDLSKGESIAEVATRALYEAAGLPLYPLQVDDAVAVIYENDCIEVQLVVRYKGPLVWDLDNISNFKSTPSGIRTLAACGGCLWVCLDDLKQKRGDLYHSIYKI